MQRGAKVTSEQILYNSIYYQKKGIQMLVQHVHKEQVLRSSPVCPDSVWTFSANVSLQFLPSLPALLCQSQAWQGCQLLGQRIQKELKRLAL